MTRGTRVRVVMTRNDVFPWQRGCSFEAVFDGGPSGPGDTYRVTLASGHPLHLNGNSAEFVAIYPAEAGEVADAG